MIDRNQKRRLLIGLFLIIGAIGILASRVHNGIITDQCGAFIGCQF